MTEKKQKDLKDAFTDIQIERNSSIEFQKSNSGDVLFFGNFNRFFGVIGFSDDNSLDIRNERLMTSNRALVAEAILRKGKIYVFGTTDTIRHFRTTVDSMLSWMYGDYSEVKRVQMRKKILRGINLTDFVNSFVKKYKTLPDKDVNNEICKVISSTIGGSHMKFRNIITNPPYDGSLHLNIFNTLLDHIETDKDGNKIGQMTIIEPSTWLINVRKNGKAKKYDAIKKRIEGHVKSVKIENLNKEFNTAMFVPFSITTIDMGQKFDTIEFECCGEKKVVDSIYDCNLVGDYKTIWSILNKVLAYGDMMDKHITTEKKEDGVWYAKYPEIVGGIGGALCAATTNLLGGNYDGDAIWKETLFGDYCSSYTSVGYHFYKNEISNHPLFAYDRGKHLLCDRYENGKFIPGKIADNIYGTKQELENWKHFIFNNKLPLFINIVLTIDQHNNSKEFLPWLVDKQYTDEEINRMFGFTQEEIDLMDATLKKFESNSPWFKRYMCGVEREDVSTDDADEKKKDATNCWWMK